MSELAFGITDCTPASQGPQLEVPAAALEARETITVSSTGRTSYVYLEKAARRFRGWLTVTAAAVIQSTVRMFRRILCAADALFNRLVLIRLGGLRL